MCVSHGYLCVAIVLEGIFQFALEAMACACCMVGSRVGGTAELIGENGRSFV
jgi:hypothetical protein